MTLLTLAVALFLSEASTRTGRYGAALTFAALLAEVAGLPFVQDRPVLDMALQIAGSASLPLFWLFARSWFDDDFRPGVTQMVWTLGYLGVSAAVIDGERGMHAPLQPLDGLLYLAGIALTIDALRYAWQNRASDLVEARRRARVAFVVIVTMVFLWTIGAEIVGRAFGGFAFAGVVGAIGMLLGIFGLALLLFGLRHRDMFAPVVPESALPLMISASPPPPPDLDEPLARALDMAMMQDRLYREPDLTIGAIAARLDVPEYRVRRLVNGRFGYRNISDYLNGLRVTEVCAALADPDQAEVPILTIAMDAGFGSLAVFNRSFKARQGETPSAYRRRHLETRPLSD
ncbi:AraC family transcriptional regulator [Sphingomonas sp.]|uniref:helix-turn-helix domain-containing protein n=1 Tax=Sphingomonas sp. TaxID=28214 RepID=UPI002896A6C1|nr:AraC family transcriptional regulator [Sphingomonas sp.]